MEGDEDTFLKITYAKRPTPEQFARLERAAIVQFSSAPNNLVFVCEQLH
jgi:hypothetical protein